MTGMCDAAMAQTSLPIDVWQLITFATQLSCGELGMLSQVCKAWRDVIIESKELWTYVDLSPYSANITDEVLARVLNPGRLSTMRSLSLRGCNQLSRRALERMVMMMVMTAPEAPPNKKDGEDEQEKAARRGIIGCVKELWGSRRGAQDMSDEMHCMTSLDFSYCSSVDDGILTNVAKMCPNLTSIHLNHLSQITDRGLVELVKGARMLKIIEANQASLSDKVLDHIEGGNFKALLLKAH